MEKIINVFFDQSGLPFKEREFVTHFPIYGKGGFLGASNTTKIRFYFENIGTLNDTYLAVSKLPNGKQGSQLLNIKSSDENGQYAELSLSEWYFQAKGDVFIGLKVYRGGVDVTIDDETGFSIVSGDPVIMVTGSIKLAINYAPIGDVPDYRDEFTAYNDILALMEEKPDIDTVPLLVDFSDYATWGTLYNYVGTRPFIAYVNGVLSVCAIESEDSDYKLLVNNSTGIFRTSTFALDSAISISLTQIELKTDNCVELTGTSGTLTNEQQELIVKPNAYIRKDFNSIYHKISADTFLRISLVEYTDYVTLFTEIIVIDTSSSHYTWTQTNKSTNIYKKEKIDSLVNGLDTKINASGHSLSATIDNQTYVMTIALKDKNNNVISIQQVDLPLESIVTSATYYDEYSYGGVDYEKVIVITLATTPVPTIAPVGDLVQGLVNESQLSVILEDYALKSNTYTKTEVDSALGNKQNTLVSGQNIKTINNQSLLGSGNINIQGGSGATWGSITGTLSNQTDLNNELTNIREVAEGKCQTYIISYDALNPRDYENFVPNRYKTVDGTYFQSIEDLDDYLYESGSEDFGNGAFDYNDDNAPIDLVDCFIVTTDYVVIPVNDHNILKKGDIILVVETDVPDRWFEGIEDFYPLETSKVDLTNYATKTEVNAKSDLTNVAPTYDTTLTYTIGEVVIYNGKIYKCTTAITIPESWDSTHWAETSVASDFVNLTGKQTITGAKTFNSHIHIGTTGNEQTYNISSLTFAGSRQRQVVFQPGAYDLKVNYYNSKIFVYGDNIIQSVSLRPISSGTYDLGNSSYKWRDLYLGRNLSDGTYSVTVAQLSGVCGSYSTNSTTQLEYSYINNISVSADTTFTLANAPSNTYPEYKAYITNSGASDITITLPSGTLIKGNVSISNNTFVIPSGSSVEVNICNSKAIVVEW